MLRLMIHKCPKIWDSSYTIFSHCFVIHQVSEDLRFLWYNVLTLFYDTPSVRRSEIPLIQCSHIVLWYTKCPKIWDSSDTMFSHCFMIHQVSEDLRFLWYNVRRSSHIVLWYTKCPKIWDSSDTIFSLCLI